MKAPLPYLEAAQLGEAVHGRQFGSGTVVAHAQGGELSQALEEGIALCRVCAHHVGHLQLAQPLHASALSQSLDHLV